MKTGTASKRPRVVIVGGGFGGLWATRALAKAPVDVTLIDQNNYHTFWPLLYQVAAAEVRPEDIAHPLRASTRSMPSVRFIMAEVTGVDLEGRLVHADGTLLPYDYLVLATGSVTHYLGVRGAAEHAYPLKSLEEGMALRSAILERFERAARESDPERRRRALTFAVVGGGPTGVEFAGALQELVRGPLARDFTQLDTREVSVVLLDAGDRLLPGMPGRLQDYAATRLRRMGVDVRLGAAVTEVARDRVQLRDGTVIPSDTAVWTAGVRASSLPERIGLPTGRGGRTLVLSTLQVPGRPEVYVVGDLAQAEADGAPLPMLAPVASQAGAHAARSILRQVCGCPATPFRYRDRGTLAVLGRNRAVARMFGLGLTGFPAWVLWAGVHLFNLIGFRNRLAVMFDWAWDYFLFERTVRLVLPRESSRAVDRGSASRALGGPPSR